METLHFVDRILPLSPEARGGRGETGPTGQARPLASPDAAHPLDCAVAAYYWKPMAALSRALEARVYAQVPAAVRAQTL